MRIGKQQEITGFAVAALALFAAVGQAFGSEGIGPVLKDAQALLPLFSIVLSAFTLMALEYEMNIAHIYQYIDRELRPQLERATGDGKAAHLPMLEWNVHRARWQQSGRVRPALVSIMTCAKYMATVVPNAVLIYFIASNSDWTFSPQTILELLAFLVAVATLVSAAFTGRLYLQMAK